MEVPAPGADRLYLRSLRVALRATAARWWRRADRHSTRRQGRRTAGPGPPQLVQRADGSLRCVGCWLCVAACPVDCIQVTARPDGAGRSVSHFELALDRCRCCGNCVAACPVEALTMGPPGAAARTSRAALQLPLEALRGPRPESDEPPATDAVGGGA